jgi:hypothetical protein
MTIKYIEVETLEGVQEHAIIEHADGSFTSMLKSEYDKRQAEQSTPNLPIGGNNE